LLVHGDGGYAVANIENIAAFILENGSLKKKATTNNMMV
jgi:hypothetical protein